MKAKVEQLTREELLGLLNRLLDPMTRPEYGEDALLICASALGISTSSAMMFDESGHVKLQLRPDEVWRRIEFVTKMKQGSNVSFHAAMREYFKRNPQPDPLAQLERALANHARPIVPSKKPKGPSFTG
jgi:hypothetical protein